MAKNGEGGDPHESRSERSTAPQSGYSGRDVAIGVIIALLGLAVTVGVPLAFSL